MSRLPAWLCAMLLALLLTACGSDFEPPVARTNPNPAERYEISVELVDPPADIVSISGVATFGIADPICMPTPDPIAGYTPGGRFDHAFSLERIGDRKYQGHFFLDWPVDEDYYGRGICRWEIAYTDIAFARASGLSQSTRLNSTELRSMQQVKSYCRASMRDRYDSVCFTPVDSDLIRELEKVSFIAIARSSN